MACLLAYGLDSARTDTSSWNVDDPLERRIVVTIGNEAQIGERVFDLCTLEKAHAAVNAVRNTRYQQCFLECSRLRVGAIQHGKLASTHTALHTIDDAIDDELGFVALVESCVELDELALVAGRPEIFP